MVLIFPSRLNTVNNLEQYRKDNFEKMIRAPTMNFKYGQNISFDFNIDLRREFAGTVSTLAQTIGDGLHLSTDARAIFEFSSNFSGLEKIDYFHNAFFNDALVVRIEEGFISDEEIVIEREYFGDSISKVLVIAGARCHVKLTFVHASFDNNYNAEDFTLIGGESSFVELSCVQACESKHFYQRRSLDLKKNSSVLFSDFFLTRGDRILRHSHFLNERGARAKHNFSFLGTQNSRFDFYGENVHSASESFSEMHTKGVLAEKSISLTRSLIKIHENAAFSDGYEKHDVLLLGKDIESNAIPNLEIHNHSVKCSHGTSSGKISQDSLFYLMSRGVSERDAKRELVKGFLGASEKQEIFEKQIAEVLK